MSIILYYLLLLYFVFLIVFFCRNCFEFFSIFFLQTLSKFFILKKALENNSNKPARFLYLLKIRRKLKNFVPIFLNTSILFEIFLLFDLGL